MVFILANMTQFYKEALVNIAFKELGILINLGGSDLLIVLVGFVAKTDSQSQVSGPRWKSRIPKNYYYVTFTFKNMQCKHGVSFCNMAIKETLN